MVVNTKSAHTHNRIVRFAATRSAEPAGVDFQTTQQPLHGQVALVAGATHGIGRCVSKTLAKLGATVAIHTDNDPRGAESLRQTITQPGMTHLSIQADLGDEDACNRMAASVFETLGHVDILIHTTAAITEPQIHKMHRRQWDDIVHDHLGAAYNLTRAVINPMRQRNFGRIVLVTEPPLFRDDLSRSCPAPATVALEGLARTLALENAGHGITANCVCPGLMASSSPSAISDAQRDRMQMAIPFARLGLAEEVAGLIEFLAMPQASYITGQIIHVDGGLSL